MTHAEIELDRLKKAFDVWAQRDANAGYTMVLPDMHAKLFSRREVADLFFPFVAYALNDMQGSAEKTAMLNRFKSALGMELMAHERFFGDEK